MTKEDALNALRTTYAQALHFIASAEGKWPEYEEAARKAGATNKEIEAIKQEEVAKAMAQFRIGA